METERVRIQYRVVADGEEGRPFTLTLHTEEIDAALKGLETWRGRHPGVRLQQRTVTKTPWEEASDHE